MEMNDLTTDGQAQSKTPVVIALVFGGEIGSENAAQILFTNALTLIDDTDAPPAARGFGFGQLNDFNANLRVMRRSVNGVGNNVADQALDQHDVHLEGDLWQLYHYHFDFLALQLGLYQVEGFDNHLIQPAFLNLEGVILGEEERFFDVGVHGFDVAQGCREQFGSAVADFGLAG